MKTSGVYKIVCTVSNNFYIGSSCDFKTRWARHRSDLRLQKHSSKQLQRAYNKYGLSSLVFEIVEECQRTECITREQFYLDKLEPKYNSEKIAGAWAGKTRNNKPSKNRNFPKELIAKRVKIECVTLGICFTHYENCIEFFKQIGINLSSGNLGSVLGGRRKHTRGLIFRKIENPKEFKQKELKNRLKVTNVETGEVLDSINDLSRKLGICSQNLGKMLIGKRNNKTGWKLVKIED